MHLGRKAHPQLEATASASGWGRQHRPAAPARIRIAMRANEDELCSRDASTSMVWYGINSSCEDVSLRGSDQRKEGTAVRQLATYAWMYSRQSEI
eukprot:4555494-Pleurochrysis_carterae.AAC.1